MLIQIVYNSRSGRGRAARVARQFETALREAGLSTLVQPVDEPTPDGGTPALLLLVGGDGTVKHSLTHAARTGTPVYHVPLGNENLFAREFGMRRDPRQLLRAIEAWTVGSLDLGAVTAERRRELFSIMLSVGPDASVIHRMERDGRSARGHLAYLAPIADELVEPRIVPITARVDGQPLADNRPGLLVVANLRHYGFRVNPAPDADAQDGLLDAVFIPARSLGPLCRAAILARVGRLHRLPGTLVARGRSIEIVAPGGLAQVDGEALHLSGTLRVEPMPGALRVLLPARPGPSGPAVSRSV